MEALLGGIGVILLSGVVSFVLNRRPKASTAAAVSGIILGGLIGLIPTIASLIRNASDSLRWSWNAPGGSLSFGIDPLSAVFLLVVLAISIPISVCKSAAESERPFTFLMRASEWALNSEAAMRSEAHNEYWLELVLDDIPSGAVLFR